MEVVDYKSEEADCAENKVDEQLESSTTDDSSGVYQYYPHIDFMNPASCRKVKSRLGKRRTTRNLFRISTDITEHTSETNNSTNSTEDSCSDVISRSISMCPSLSEKNDFALRKTKSSADLDQENCSAPPNGQNFERQGFRNVSNSINSNNFKSTTPFFQEKLCTTDTSKSEIVPDIFYIPKTEQKIANSLHNTNSSQTYKTPLKQMTDNVFTGNATKANYNHVHQPNPVKNLFESKFIADTAKENAPNSFDYIRGSKKSHEVISTSAQNEKIGMYAMKKFEHQNYSRGRQSVTDPSYKNLSKATSLDDLPLDLKMKFKSEKLGHEQIFGNSKERAKNKISEVKKESEENQRPKLNLDIDSRDFINILEMPSVRRTEESPARSIYSSFSILPMNPIKSVNQSKESAASVVNGLLRDSLPQESVDLDSSSVLNLSVNNGAKTSSHVNSSGLENENSPVNQLNTDKTVSKTYHKPEQQNNGFNSERQFLEKENFFGKNLVAATTSEQNVKQVERVTPVNSSSLENKKSQVNQLNTNKSASQMYPKLEQQNNVHGFNSERQFLEKENSFGKNLIATMTIEQNVKQAERVSPVNRSSLENKNSQVNQQNHGHDTVHGFNSERQFLEKENSFGKNLMAAKTCEQNVKQAERVTSPVFRNACPDSKPFENYKLETEKNIFKFSNKENESFERLSSTGNKPVPEYKAPTMDTRYLAQEIFKKPSAQVLPMKVSAPDPFKKPTQPLTLSGGGSSIPVAVSQASSLNPNFVLPKLNPRPNKPTYSFASDVAKFCQKEGGAKVNLLKAAQPAPPSNIQLIKVNNRSYQMLSTIGRGGSSEVYLVLDPNNKSLMAIKVVKLASVDESIAEGYMNEVKLLEKLQGCPSVIRMFDYEYIQESKKLYVVMEKGDTDLSRLLKDINKSKKISMSMIIYYWTEMLTAVQEIHEKGIIHSDLKPANFLLVSGRLKLIDFGIASSIQGDMTSVHKDICAGTENYISPEALQDGTGSNDKKYKISYKSDVWSLGCILYNLIYGKTPFSHITSRWSKMYAIISSSHKIDFPDYPMPPVLRSALQSCLIRDPKQRATVKELLELPYHTPALPNDLPFKIQQLLPEESWHKISHLFSDPVKSDAPQGK